MSRMRGLIRADTWSLDDSNGRLCQMQPRPYPLQQRVRSNSLGRRPLPDGRVLSSPSCDRSSTRDLSQPQDRTPAIAHQSSPISELTEARIPLNEAVQSTLLVETLPLPVKEDEAIYLDSTSASSQSSARRLEYSVPGNLQASKDYRIPEFMKTPFEASAVMRSTSRKQLQSPRITSKGSVASTTSLDRCESRSSSVAHLVPTVRHCDVDMVVSRQSSQQFQESSTASSRSRLSSPVQKLSPEGRGRQLWDMACEDVCAVVDSKRSSRQDGNAPAEVTVSEECRISWTDPADEEKLSRMVSRNRGISCEGRPNRPATTVVGGADIAQTSARSSVSNGVREDKSIPRVAESKDELKSSRNTTSAASERSSRLVATSSDEKLPRNACKEKISSSRPANVAAVPSGVRPFASGRPLPWASSYASGEVKRRTPVPKARTYEITGGAPFPRDSRGLKRFTEAQKTSFSRALSEIVAGRKAGCWMWFMIPTPPFLVDGVERGSAINRRYALRTDQEAHDYLTFECDGVNLRNNYLELMHAIMDQLLTGKKVESLMGHFDAPKLRSSAILFERISREAGDMEFHSIMEEMLALLQVEPQASAAA